MAKTLAAILVLGVLLLSSVGCGSQPQATNPQPPPATGGGTGGGGTGGGGAGGAKVTIANFAFSPATVNVKVGDTVTWTNDDSTAHQVYSDDGQIKGPEMSQGATFSYTFKKAGTVAYHCNIHKQMTGTVVVK